MLYANFGSLNLSVIASVASSINKLQLALIFTGLSVEAKLFPLNGWVKGIFKNTNGLVGSLMASVVASVSLMVMGRIIDSLMISDFLANLILIVAVVTLIAGELSAYKSKTIKEILLYSSIGQSGLVTILFVSGFVFPALLVIINNSIVKMMMFTIGHRLTPHNEEYTTVKGYFASNKLLGLSFTIASFSLIGLPLFFGFYAKLNSLMALFESNMLLPAVILIITIVEGAYLIRLNIALWHPGEEGELTTEIVDHKMVAPEMILATVLLSVVIIAVGFLPDVLGDKMLDQTILDDHTEYITDLKGGM
jgi:multicomponent Na+:H+ antiporter subunit D